MADETTSLKHPAKLDLNDPKSREFSPALREDLQKHPEAFSALLRPFFAERYWQMLQDFDLLTVAQKLEFLKLGAEVSNIKNTKQDSAVSGVAPYQLVINLGNTSQVLSATPSSNVIDGTAITVEQTPQVQPVQSKINAFVALAADD